MVFHSPQVSQRPAHFGVTAPQVAQTKRAGGLAMLYVRFGGWGDNLSPAGQQDK